MAGNAMGANIEIGSYEISKSLASSEEGYYNAVIAAQKINGFVVNPGCTFSYNAVLGKRTPANGYIMGPIAGQSRPGYGGGICMTSGILHQAVLKAGLPVIERHNHVTPVRYLVTGQDAAVTWGVEDYRFFNNRLNPVVIYANIKDASIMINLIETTPDTVNITFNDQNLNMITINQNESILVPIRDITESLGGQVSWDETNGTASITGTPDEIMIQKNKIYINGVEVPAQTLLFNNRIMVPIKWIEKYGFVVEWAENSITITKYS